MLVHFSILISILILFIIHKDSHRKRIVLPLSVLFIGIYWALEYDYGLDYWNYHDIFYYDRSYSDRHGDAFFWSMMFFFEKYYQFVLFYGLFVAMSVWFIVNKYVREKYYWLFFLIFMLHPSLCCNMSYAFRSAFTACLLWYGISFFYIDKYKLLLLIFFILFAAQFHHSMYVLLILPLFDIIVRKANPRALFFLLIVALFIGSSSSLFIFSKVTESVDSFENYAHYGEDRINGISLIMLASRVIHLFPAFYIVRALKSNSILSRISVLAILYYFIYFMGVDMLGRFTTTLFIFVIIASFMIIDGKKSKERLLILTPSIIFSAQRCIQFYIEMSTTYIVKPGNMLIYQTIFDAPKLP